MTWRLMRWLGVGLCLLAWPQPAPAPLIYRPGEGWSYERVGREGKWIRDRAKDQLEVAQAAFDKQDYGLALKAARRVVKQWPLSDFAPQAQYLMGRCYEAKKQDEKAFREYQKLIEKHPKLANYPEVLERQFAIANRFLAGQWFKLWGVIPFFRSMNRTAEMFQKVVDNGPFSEPGVQSQMNIGAAREKRSDYLLAVKAYEKAADRYHDRPAVAAEALFRAGLAYSKEARKAEYDQTIAGKAIATLTDFVTLYPDDPRVPQAQEVIRALKTEQARGCYQIARFYEKRKRWAGALIYYNEVLQPDRESPYAADARQRFDAIKRRLATANP